ncbi:hypothetical protein Pmani_016941 [Petrolisthes manimaculis]|uniref:SKA complex subunit 1 n=1 Tax=Petrolisthes manimaculis TaxID=1843537 RepID=A0AAE1PN91_9EUCA|nr:hypothetical protein Pmani_016941 [Petrolisthes manimaculis]
MSRLCSSNITTLRELEEVFTNKIEDLKVCDALRGGWADDTVVEFSHLSKEVEQIKEDLASYRTTIARAKQDIVLAHSLLNMVSQLSARVAHMKANLPTHLPQPGVHLPKHDTNSKKQTQVPEKQPHNAITTTAAHTTTTTTTTTTSHGKGVTKVGAQMSKHIPVLIFITVEEFESVPKYIRGRLQYEQVNAAIKEVNRALEAKYTLMARPRNKLSEADMNVVRDCKRQESTDTKGVYFVVGEDIKRWSTLRLDRSGHSLLTIIRTLKRIREVRGPGSLVRFAVI